MQEWELVVIELLDWDLSAVTPVDFVEQMLSRLSDVFSDAAAVKRHAITFITMCTTGQCSLSSQQSLPLYLSPSSMRSVYSVLCSIIEHEQNLEFKKSCNVFQIQPTSNLKCE